MPKHNNAIPHIHLKKHWNPCSSQKGNVKLWLDQPMRKLRRRRLRLVKAKKAFPRPAKMLRPQVNCPTVRYNMKKRLGRGFTVEEIKAAGIEQGPRYAATIGIKVDTRRKNLSEEGLAANVQRLKTYMSKLVLFPLDHKKVDKTQLKTATQDKSRFATGVVAHPTVAAVAEPARKLTSDEAKTNIYKFLKKNHSAVRFMGARMARAAKKAEKEKKA